MEANIKQKEGTKKVNLNRRWAIRERCLDCAGWSQKAVADCHFDDCSLHPFRMPQEKQNRKDRILAIRRYCLSCMDKRPYEVKVCPSTTCALFTYKK